MGFSVGKRLLTLFRDVFNWNLRSASLLLAQPYATHSLTSISGHPGSERLITGVNFSHRTAPSMFQAGHLLFQCAPLTFTPGQFLFPAGASSACSAFTRSR